MAEEGEAVWALFKEIRDSKISTDRFIAKFEEILKNGRLQTLRSIGDSNNTIFHEALSLVEASKVMKGMLKQFPDKDGEIVEILNQKNNGGQTILHLAEQKEFYDLVELIVQFMPSVQPIRHNLQIALYEILQASVENEDVQRFNKLLDLIPGDNRFDFLRKHSKDYDSSVVHIAFAKGNAEILRVIKKSFKCDSQKHLVRLLKEENSESDTPVQLAIFCGNLPMIPLLKEMLESPEDMCNVLRAGTASALRDSYAAGIDYFEAVFALIPEKERKSMLLRPMEGNQNVVHQIFCYKDVEFLKVIESVLDEVLMSTDANGSTPLHLAAEKKNYEIMQHVIESPKTNNSLLFKLFTKINSGGQSVVSIASERDFDSQILDKIVETLARHMKDVKSKHAGCKNKYETSKKEYTKAEKRYCQKNKEVQDSKLAKEKSNSKYCQKAVDCYEAHHRDLQKCQKILNERYKDWSKKKKELDRNESTRQAIAKNLQLVKLVIHKGGSKLSSLVTGLLELMDSPIESLGLLILHAESGNADFISNHEEFVRQTLEKSFLDLVNSNQALKHLKMRVKQDISDEEIRESRQNLLGLATSNMADHTADQYILRWTDSSGNTLAHIAALAEDIESIKRLVEWQITSHPSNKDSVLHSVNSAGHTPATVSLTTQNSLDWELELLEKLGKYLGPLETGPDGLKFLIFYQSKNREGAKEEADNLEKFGEAFGVEPEVYADRTCDQIKKAIKPENKNAKPASCLIVAILAHGTSGQVEVSDGKMEIKDIVEQMKIRQSNRPMVLLLQACQSELPELPYPERQPGDVLQEDMPEGATVTDYLNDTQRQPESTLREMLSRHKVPRNIKLQSVPPLEMVRSDNLVLRSTFVVGKMVNDLNNTSRNVQEMRNIGTDAISMLSQAYCFLKGRPVRTRTTADGYPEEYDISITSGYAFDHVPPHFLCMSATVNAGTATRGLMTKLLHQKLNEMIDHQKSLPGPVEIDIQRLFEHVLAAVHVESLNGQVSIIAQTLLKRLCLRVKRPKPQSKDNGNDDEDMKGHEASNKGDNSQQSVS